MKPRDPLLDAVGRHLAERDGLADPRWDALANAELSPEDAAALAARGDAHPLAYDAFRPLDDAEQEALAAAALAAMDDGAPPRSTTPPRPDPAPAPSPALSPQGGKVIPLRPRGRGRWLALAAPLAAAAALVLFLRGGPEPVPGYGLVVEGGRSAQRATPAASAGEDKPVKLGAEERLRVVLRPDTAFEGTVAARAYLLGPRGLRPLDVPMEPGPHGTVVVPELRADMLGDGPAGTWQVLFVVGRPGALPAEAEVAGHAPKPGDAFRVLRVLVTTGGDPPYPPVQPATPEPKP